MDLTQGSVRVCVYLVRVLVWLSLSTDFSFHPLEGDHFGLFPLLHGVRTMARLTCLRAPGRYRLFGPSGLQVPMKYSAYRIQNISAQRPRNQPVLLLYYTILEYYLAPVVLC